jgi:hypothetical protein
MAFTYDLATDTGKVRLLVPDNRAASYILEDDEIGAFLTLEGANVRRAAALALETIASDHAMTLKAIRVLDLQTDGPKVADSLIKRAAKLREQADRVEQAEDGGAFDIAEMGVDEFAQRERLTNELLRSRL